MPGDDGYTFGDEFGGEYGLEYGAVYGSLTAPVVPVTEPAGRDGARGAAGNRERVGPHGETVVVRAAGPAEPLEVLEVLETPEPVERVVERMARREGGGHLLVPPSLPLPPGDASPPVAVRRVPCPWCGAERDEVPLPGGLPRITMLACESLTNRSLLPVVVARHPAEGGYLTRAAYWASHAPARLDDDALVRLIVALDAAERWADTMEASDSPAVIPAGTRFAGTAGATGLTGLTGSTGSNGSGGLSGLSGLGGLGGLGGLAAGHFLTPHPDLVRPSGPVPPRGEASPPGSVPLLPGSVTGPAGPSGVAGPAGPSGVTRRADPFERETLLERLDRRYRRTRLRTVEAAFRV